MSDDMPGSGRMGRRGFLSSALAGAVAGLAAGGPASAQQAAGEAPAELPMPGDGQPTGVYPDRAYSRPLRDDWPVFRTLSGCCVLLDSYARAEHLPGSDLRVVSAGPTCHARWRLRPRGIETVPLRLDEKLRRAPLCISLRLLSRSASTFEVGLQAHELPWMPGRENQATAWTVGPPQRVEPGQEQELSFAWADSFSPSLAIPRAPRFPISALILCFQGLKQDEDYDIDLLSFVVHYPPAAGITLRRLDAPALLQPGGEALFGLAADAHEDLPDDLALELRQGDWVLWRYALSQEEGRALRAGDCRVVRTVPWHLGGGEVHVGLTAGGYRVAGPEGEEVAAATEVAATEAPDLPRAERRLHGGRPTCFVDGEPFPWCGFSSADFQPGSVAQFGAGRTTVFCIPAAAGAHVYHHTAAPTWIGPELWDFGEIGQRVGMALQANPDARLMLRLSLGLPPFWTQEHRDQQVLVDTDLGLLPWAEYNAYEAPSLASEVWREAQEQAIRRVVAYCRSQPWASRLMGFWLTCEVTEEWFSWGSNDGRYADYSAPNQERFAAWLRARGLPASEGGIPPAATRNVPDRDLYPDTPEGALAAAYSRYYSDLTGETIAHFCRILKDATDGRSLVGAFCGYVIQLAGEPRQALAGNMGLRRLLDEEAVDFLGGIPLHDFRRLCGGYNPYISATESILAAGKLYCNENDLFSWLHPVIWYTEYDPADPRGGAIAMHRRETASDMVHGAMTQRFGLMCSWHDDAALQEEFRRLNGLCARALGLDRTGAEQIAFVVDDSSFAWVPPASTLAAKTHKELLHRLGHTGAPVGVWLLSDLHRLPERIRFVVVASAAACDPADLDKLRALLRAGGRTVLVVGTPGLVDPALGRWQPEVTVELLGLPVRILDQARPGGMVLDADGSWITPEQGPVRPRAEAEGRGLLRYPDGPAAGAERALPAGGRLLWCGQPPLTTWPLLRWAKEAGVHTYAPDGYFVWASQGLVSITSSGAGEVELRWPRRVAVRDWFDGWEGEGETMRCLFAAGQTRLFELE